MTRPPRTSKILLIAERRLPAEQGGPVAVRRFRLARLPLAEPAPRRRAG